MNLPLPLVENSKVIIFLKHFPIQFLHYSPGVLLSSLSHPSPSFYFCVSFKVSDKHLEELEGVMWQGREPVSLIGRNTSNDSVTLLFPAIASWSCCLLSEGQNNTAAFYIRPFSPSFIWLLLEQWCAALISQKKLQILTFNSCQTNSAPRWLIPWTLGVCVCVFVYAGFDQWLRFRQRLSDWFALFWGMSVWYIFTEDINTQTD